MLQIVKSGSRQEIAIFLVFSIKTANGATFNER